MIATRPNVQLDGLYSATQAAQALEISPKTVYNYRHLGIVEGRIRKATGRWVCTGEEVIKMWREMF